MYTRVLSSSLLLLVLLRDFSRAGAIRDSRRSDGHELVAKRPDSSVIHFPEPQDSLLQPQPPSSDSVGSATGSFLRPGRRRVQTVKAAATPLPEPRPLLDEDKLIQFEASGKKKLRPPATETPSTVKPVEGPAVGTAPQGAGDDFNFSQLSEILKELLNATDGQERPTTVRPTTPPVTSATRQKPSVSPAGVGTEFDKFLPHLVEALQKALETEASEKPLTSPATGRPLPAPTSPPPDSTEEVFKGILPALEEQLGSILEKVKQDETTAAPLPTQRPVQSVTRDDGEHFSQFLPLLEDALKDVLAKGEEQEQAAGQQHSKQSSQPTGSYVPSTTSPPSMPTNTSSDFDGFLPELEKVFRDIMQDAELGQDNELGNKPERPNASQKPLPPLPPQQTSAGTSNSAAGSPDDPIEGFDNLFKSLESSLAEILNDQTLQTPEPLGKPSEAQINLIAPQPKIVYQIDKYYPQLKKVLEEIVREDGAISARPTLPQPSRTTDVTADQAVLQAIYSTAQAMFSGNSDTNVGSPNTGKRPAAT